ncbi:MAG TPA: ATP-binding protein [Planctomycetota bacterium]|nr:ATP-binding protein [Planctomycetota bacterium]
MAAAPKTKKQMEREARAEQASRMAYIGTLASGLAHEIRSPLNGIRLNLDLIKEDLEAVDASKREEFKMRIGLIDREVEGLQKVLTDFLTYARPPKLEMLPADLNHVLEDIRTFILPEAERRHIQIATDYQEQLYPIALDQNQFGRGVILNLLTNAMEQIGEHGTIILHTRETPDFVEIAIEDNGGGVRKENEARIFELFFSTKDHGTGLGLAIARRIVQEHGGELILENHPGKGATFIMRLPKSKILEFMQPGKETK